jgi:hypothetical protein
MIFIHELNLVGIVDFVNGIIELLGITLPSGRGFILIED